MGLNNLPLELFDLIIEYLVITVGPYKSVLLRTVNHAFNVSILNAICVSQVVDIDDRATSNIVWRMPPSMRAKIFVTKSASVDSSSKTEIKILAQVNQALDRLVGPTEPDETTKRYEAVAAAICPPSKHLKDAHFGLHDILGGAVVIGNIQIVQQLLDQEKTSIHGFTPYFHDPLAIAAASGDHLIVNCLLDRGARPDSACQHWRESRSLANLDQWNAAGEPSRYAVLHEIDHPSALSAAVRGGHREIVDLLLLPKYRLPTDSLEYLRAILAAGQIGRLDLVDLLFSTIGKKLSDLTNFGNWVMFTAIQYNQIEVVRMLLEQGVDVNATTTACCGIHSTLAIAASKGHIDMAKLLLGYGADVHLAAGRPKKWPMEGAARNGHEEMVSLLIEHGVDPKRALWHAASGGQARLIRSLLNRHPDLLSREGGTIARSALSRAVVIGNLDSITVLVEAGVSVKEEEYSVDGPRPTLVDHAKGLGPWVVEHLLALGAPDTDNETNVDPDTYDLDGELAANRLPSHSARGVLLSKRTWQWVSKY